jgi:hypothetical protein
MEKKPFEVELYDQMGIRQNWMSKSIKPFGRILTLGMTNMQILKGFIKIRCFMLEMTY